MAAGTIFHITEPALWADARAAGRYECSTRDATLAEVGFIHCSFRHQVEMVANFIYDDYDGDLIVLAIDSAQVDAPIREENLEGGDELFPHIYGPLAVTAVIDVSELHPESGRWVFTDGSTG